MSIEVIKESDCTHINVSENSLVGNIVDDLKIQAVNIIESGEKKIILNLWKTNYIDSSGIGKLLFINKKIITNGGNMEIINITPMLLNFLQTLAIDKIIKIKK